VDRGSQLAPTCEIFWTFKGGFGGGRGLLVRHGCVSLGRRVLNFLLASWAGESARCSLGHSVGHFSPNSFLPVSISSRSVACFQPNRAFLLCALSSALSADLRASKEVCNLRLELLDGGAKLLLALSLSSRAYNFSAHFMANEAKCAYIIIVQSHNGVVYCAISWILHRTCYVNALLIDSHAVATYLHFNLNLIFLSCYKFSQFNVLIY
jgi:hypothetical protein